MLRVYSWHINAGLGCGVRIPATSELMISHKASSGNTGAPSTWTPEKHWLLTAFFSPEIHSSSTNKHWSLFLLLHLLISPHSQNNSNKCWESDVFLGPCLFLWTYFLYFLIKKVVESIFCDKPLTPFKSPCHWAQTIKKLIPITKGLQSVQIRCLIWAGLHITWWVGLGTSQE